MNGHNLKKNRRLAGWTQERLAARLGVTQAYLSLMERGHRAVPRHVTRAATRVLQLSASHLPLPPVSVFDAPATEHWVEQALARLEYPGLAYRKTRGTKRNPTELLLRALAYDNLDPRLVEALPWLLLRFEEFDFETLTGLAKARDLQNRLGFTVSLARQVAEYNPHWSCRVQELRCLEGFLEPSRLAREDTYGRVETSERMREWIRQQRSAVAEHWNLLTDLKMEQLPYVGEDPGALA